MTLSEFCIRKFFADPVTYTVCFFLIALIFVGILFCFVKLLSDPVGAFFKQINPIMNKAFDEIKLKAGYAGVADLILTILIFFLAIIVLIKPHILFFFGTDPKEAFKYSIVTIGITGVIFLTSLIISVNFEKFIKQLK